MKRFLLKYYRIIMIIIVLVGMLLTVIINQFDESALPYFEANIPFVYQNQYELDDYILYVCQYETGIDYIIEHKNTKAKRRVLTNESGDGLQINSIQTYKNDIYYGAYDGYYCYNIKDDSTKQIYKDHSRDKDIEVFDVTVYYRSLSRADIENSAMAYLLSNGRLLIFTNRGVYVYDGKNTKEMLAGSYSVLSCCDGIVTMWQDGKETKIELSKID